MPPDIRPPRAAALRLAPGKPKIVGAVPVGRLGVDGNRLVGLEDGVLAERRRMNFAGLAFVSLGFTEDGDLSDVPKISLRGVSSGEERADLLAELEEEIERVALRGAERHRGPDQIAEDVRRAVRGICNRLIGKKPVTEVHVFRL